MTAEQDVFDQQKVAFTTKVSKTKYCRINAYKRCNDWKMFLVFVSFLYNISLVVASILSISVYKEVSLLNVAIAVLSVIVFAISLFASSLDFSRKANEYCRCYQALEEVLREAGECKDETSLNRVKEKYNTIIDFSLNHEECDYYRFMVEYPNGIESFRNDDNGFKLSDDQAKERCEKFNRDIRKKNSECNVRRTLLRTILALGPAYLIYLSIVALLRKKK